jgi:exo-1,4-beta-D-glucosaminidase
MERGRTGPGSTSARRHWRHHSAAIGADRSGGVRGDGEQCDRVVDSTGTVAGYDVYRNGTLLDTATGTSFADASVAPSTTYSYTVAAYDTAGNTSAQSTPLSVTTPPGSPGGATYEADAATLGGSADANSCSACLDGQKVSDIGGSGQGTVTFTGVSEPTTGTYTMTVYYLSVGKARPAVITVNGTAQTITFAETSSSSYSVIGTATVTVTLNAGSANTIEFSGDGTKGAPDLDHIVV